jgi:F-type H+-transporting ATPase subunit alpha
MDAPDLETSLDDTAGVLDGILHSHRPEIRVEDVGTVSFVGQGIVRVTGLRGVKSEELIAFTDGLLGMAFNLDEKETGVILLDESTVLFAGSEARRTGRVMDIPVGDALLGRVLDAKGRPLDGGEPIGVDQRRPVEQPAPSIMDRAPVTVPLQTGIKVVDALIPIGRGQRELILGDRQTGKTAIALDTVINQKDRQVICIYCAVGKRGSSVAKVIADLRAHGAMDYCIVVVATEENPPGLQFIAPMRQRPSASISCSRATMCLWFSMT